MESGDYSQTATTPFKPYQPALTFFNSGEERSTRDQAGKEEDQQLLVKRNKQLSIPTTSGNVGTR